MIDVAAADWGTKMQSAVQSALVKDSGVNYVIPLYDSAIQFVLIDSDGEGRVEPTTNEAPGTTVSTHTIGAVIEAWSGCSVPSDRNRPSDGALLGYTSGTTGPPKGAENTHGNLFHNACVMADWFGLDGHDT